jgi:DNA-binding NtrC family response regulator
VDSELFGHEKGAFTGAVETRTGVVEAAHGSTLLLDEIGDIPQSAQTRLLRFLERGLFRKTGSSREQEVDVRILAATNRDLSREVSKGIFREDLYHRLLVFRLEVPPLSKRPDDIMPLAEHFLHLHSAKHPSAPSFTEACKKALESHSWPGNVRELSHTIERAYFSAHLSGSSAVEEAHLGLTGKAEGPSVLRTLREVEDRHIASVLEHVEYNRRKAAEILGISERHLYRLLSQNPALLGEQND